MTPPKAIQQTLPGEWYWLAIVFGAAQPAYEGIWLSGPRGVDGARWVAFEDDPPREIGSITFTPARGLRTTVIEIAPATDADLQKYWYPAYNRLEAHAREAQDLRRDRQNTADEAVEYYYRMRGPGQQRKTLREVAEKFNIGYEALRKQKQRYDARGGWGSKKGTKPSQKTGE